jgi:two-component system, cell cycle sensor histidine kinase and response regulator CckA
MRDRALPQTALTQKEKRMFLQLIVGGGVLLVGWSIFRCWRRRADVSERLHTVTLSSIADAVIATDLVGAITFINPEAQRLTGWPREEAIGRQVEDVLRVVAAHTDAVAENPVAAILRTGQPQPLANHTRLQSRDGRSIPIEHKASPIRHVDGTMEGVVLIFRDCTRQYEIEEALRERERASKAVRKLEGELRQAQKMESVGLLAGGVAHDFNNALTVIMGSTEVLAEELSDHPDATAMLEDIRSATDRAAALTRQLLAFSRKDVVAPRVIDFNALVSQTERMLRRLLGEDIQLTARLDPEIAHVKVDPGQWDQVLVNLAVNARDAITGCGHLAIATRDVRIGRQTIPALPAVPPGRYVELSVSDSGFGMTPDVMARIFEPFFTTKGVGRGTGLGLAVVYGIVQQSGGYIDVQSEVGNGTTFRMLIPAVAAEIERGIDPTASSRSHSGGGETVLLVEDEDSLRRMAARLLTQHGYRVVQASSGPEALRMLEAQHTEIDVLVTDVVMPGMDGRELARKVRHMRPSIGVLFTSGYAQDAMGGRGGEMSGAAFLQKPYASGVLASKVWEALERRENLTAS